MNKLFSLLLGLGVGAIIGVALVMLFAPQTGEQFASSLKRSWTETLTEARHASQQRRAELESQLAAKRRAG